ncbi:hypothetical protein [Clostridium sp. UBA6640]|uniref:hypothetical protein n=1 Tax=Clostridium sp. UBA6640 TaxID=1946370 RepID=UPI0025BE8341|nr:hypothetical protein [Clostridium sp. UBA6640]
MKIKKRTAMITSFTLGLVMFATTAMAEISSKSGYDQMKDAFKYSAESFSDRLSNYTIDISMNIKDNGKVIISDNTVAKLDATNKAEENYNTEIRGNKKTEYYSYSDENVRITANDDKSTYYVSEYESPIDKTVFDNPFKMEEAGDIEKIADAIVGNLKDYVVVNEKAEGSKELSGSIKDAQIPALINAVTSYMIKSRDVFGYDSREEQIMPTITKDAYVKEIDGKMVVDKDGLVQNLIGTATIFGKDEQGKEHTLTVELLVKVSNVNSTVVSKPDLSGKKVEKNIVSNNEYKLEKPEMYLGKYKSDIIIKKDGKFQKIGERIINITHSDDKSIGGTYHQEYAEGYKDYEEKISDMKFDAEYREDAYYHAEFNVEGSSNKGYISLNVGESKFHFGMPTDDGQWYDGQFNRVFE